MTGTLLQIFLLLLKLLVINGSLLVLLILRHLKREKVELLSLISCHDCKNRVIPLGHHIII